MSAVYNYLRDGGMILKIKPTVTNCNTLKVFPTFDVGLKHLLTVANGTGTGRYTGNELIQIIANSVNNYYFDHWNDPHSVVTDVNAGTTTVTMPFLDCTVTAVILPYRTLTVNNGTGSSNILKPGDVRQIVANAPAQNYVFDSWSGDTAYLSANTSTANITMPDANIVLTANYKIEFTTIKYGYLYNRYAGLLDSRKITSSDTWRIPTFNDYNVTLKNYVSNDAGSLKSTGTSTWLAPNTGATNIYGFSGLPSGYRNYQFYSLHYELFMMLDYSYAVHFTLYYDDIIFRSGGVSDNHGESIRLVKNATSEELLLSDGVISTTYTGNDGKTYRTCKIGTQIWTVSNLVETKYRNGDLISVVTDDTAWGTLTSGARCVYNNDENNA